MPSRTQSLINKPPYILPTPSLNVPCSFHIYQDNSFSLSWKEQIHASPLSPNLQHSPVPSFSLLSAVRLVFSISLRKVEAIFFKKSILLPIYLKPLIIILKITIYFLIEFISFPASFGSIMLGSISYIKIYVYVLLLKYQPHEGRDSCLISSLLEYHFPAHHLAFTLGPPP